MADGIAAFIAARLDEDERVADAVVFACRDSRQPWPPEQAPGRGGPALTAYLKHFSENRALREIAAKRAILAGHEHHAEELGGTNYGFGCLTCDWDNEHGMPDPGGWCPTLRALAAIWDAHADYRAEWAPAEVIA